MISRSTNGSNRDHQGKFVKGCRPGPGNPHVAKVAQWRSVLTECVSGEDIEAVIRALVRAARAGERWAIRELLDRCLGKPTQMQELGSAADGQAENVVLKLQFADRQLIEPQQPPT